MPNDSFPENDVSGVTATLVEYSTPAVAALNAFEWTLGQTARERIPDLLGKIEYLRGVAWMMMLSQPAKPRDGVTDQLLTVEEAAHRLRVSKDWLYRRSGRLPFEVRLGRRLVRYSSQGVDRWIKNGLSGIRRRGDG